MAYGKYSSRMTVVEPEGEKDSTTHNTLGKDKISFEEDIFLEELLNFSSQNCSSIVTLVEDKEIENLCDKKFFVRKIYSHNLKWIHMSIEDLKAPDHKFMEKWQTIKVLLKEDSQIIFSPGPIIYNLRQKLKNFTQKDYLLLTGDPAIIGIACSVVSDITNGIYNLLKWDRQESTYYPIRINLYEKGEIDE